MQSPSNPAPVGRERKFVVVGHPGSKRVELFQAALTRLGWPPAKVVAYRDLLDDRDTLSQALQPDCLVRLESPGRDFEVEKQLLALGAEVAETEAISPTAIAAAEARHLEYDHGRIWYPRQWYRGFRELLGRLKAELAGYSGVQVLNPPDDVAVMFDKRHCQQLFANAGIPVPPGLGVVRSCDELWERLRTTGRKRVFVKLAHGSSASGVLALAVNGARMRAWTTVELVRDAGGCRLYNSRRIRVYEQLAEVTAIVDAICREGAQVEEWIPKAGVEGYSFDLRVLVVGGQVRQTVVRMSQTPMTNLHLLNPRGDLDRVRAKIQPERWEAAMDSCRRAAGLFPGSLHAGVDLVFTPTYRWHGVLEINAFGDLLPGVVCDGCDTYETELVSLADPWPQAADKLTSEAACGYGRAETLG